MKKVLITGANGFIGSHLTEEALSNGFNVFAGIRKTSDLSNIGNLPVTFIEIDFSDKEKIKKTLTKYGRFDYIIHNAGLTKSCKKHMFYEVNYENTKRFIEVLFETDSIPEKFVYMSSLAAYGPVYEATLRPVDNFTIPNPISEYGKSKLKTEQFIVSRKKFPYLIFRPTGVYGPREKDYYVLFKNIKNKIETYGGIKNQQLTFVYVLDLVRLIVKAMTSDIANKSYFVTDLNQYTAIEFNKIIKEELNVKTLTLVFPKSFVRIIAFLNEKLACMFLNKVPTLNRDKCRELIKEKWLCDSSPLVNDFDYRPEFNLQKGVHNVIQWYVKEKLL